MPWPLSRARLVQVLERTERHISSIAASIERQKQTIAQLEARGRGNSETAATLRALVASMEKAHAMYVRDRARITRLIATTDRDE